MTKLKKQCIGMTIHTKGFVVEVKEENIKMLQVLGIEDVFEEQPKKVKFKGIKEDDNNNNESSDK